MRRTAFIAATAAALGLAATRAFGAGTSTSPRYAVAHSDAEWRKLLGPDRYDILRQNGTEPAFSSQLLQERRQGIYRCYGCDLALFSSKVKYDSGDGWPSFWTVLPNATRTRSDYELIDLRTEVHCRQCGGHLGHIFDDGPKPTGLRYCIDGLALRFISGAIA
jgi:peptide-methionine (R)-S-oxide reductase